MKGATYFITAAVFFSSCQVNPESLLEQAKNQLNEKAYISYHHSALWPNIIGEIDTIAGITKLQKNQNLYFEYDFIGLRDKYDLIYIRDDFTLINHEEKVVTVYSPEDLKKDSKMVSENMLISNSPISFLREGDWIYLSDTIVGDSPLSNFYLIESDTVFDGKKVHVEKHIFINPKSALLEMYERRAFLDGEKSQFITFSYSDYELKEDPVDFNYEFPELYITKVAGDKKKVLPLEEGNEAPDFVASDMDGNLVQLSSLRGQKVLLNFSIINCGWCKVAIDHFNHEDFKLSNNIRAYYVNPVDSKTEMEKYIKKFNVPFPVIPEANALGKSYRVNGYPTFYLINEEGRIEKVSVGYREDFINEFALK